MLISKGAKKVLTVDDVQLAAKELTDRYGDTAIDVAMDRVKQLEAAGDWPAHAIALLVLTEVERKHNIRT